MPEIARCTTAVGGFACHAVVHFYTDHLGRLKAWCPACQEGAPRPEVRPALVSAPLAVTRPYRVNGARLSPELARQIADMAHATQSATAPAAAFGVTTKTVRAYYQRLYQRSLPHTRQKPRGPYQTFKQALRANRCPTCGTPYTPETAYYYPRNRQWSCRACRRAKRPKQEKWRKRTA